MSTKTQGFGFERYGDPFGAGGPLYVMRARAVEGQTVRIVFDEEPLHLSPAGFNDGLNPANYQITVVSGDGRVPLVVGVKEQVIPGPDYAVNAGEYALDLQTDWPLFTAITYRVTARNLIAVAGGAQGAPYSADFVGMMQPALLPKLAPFQGNIDLKGDPVTGGLFTDNGGDLALDQAPDSYRKRIIRRMVTPKNAFSFLPNYGTALLLKRPASFATLGSLKLDLTQQILQEPETARVDVSVSLQAGGVLTVAVRAYPKTGALVETSLKVRDGAVIL